MLGPNIYIVGPEYYSYIRGVRHLQESINEEYCDQFPFSNFLEGFSNIKSKSLLRSHIFFKISSKNWSFFIFFQYFIFKLEIKEEAE